MAIIETVKKSLRIVTDAYDDLLEVYINAAMADLGVAGIVYVDPTDTLIETAIILFVKIHFGDSDNPERLKPLYDEMKAQLSMATGYTEWSVGYD